MHPPVSVFSLQILSKKVFTLYSLAMQQLSKQDHYDFGLRALTSLLRYAGKKRRTCGNVPDEEVGSSPPAGIFWLVSSELTGGEQAVLWSPLQFLTSCSTITVML